MDKIYVLTDNLSFCMSSTKLSTFFDDIQSNDDRIIEKNMPNRIIKAFEHLVKLYGGNMVSDSLF
jgi:hypothetical protein